MSNQKYMNKDPFRVGLRRLAKVVFRRTVLPACVVAILFWTFASAAQSSEKHLLRVSDKKEAARLLAAGQKLVADYGGYQLIESSSAAASSAGPSAEVVDHFNRIELNALYIDSSSVKAQQLRKPVGAFPGKRFHLVHFAGPVKPEWLQELTAGGAQIVSYVPNNAYLIYGDYAALTGVQTLAATAPHIKWEGEYLPEYKIHPAAQAIRTKNGMAPPATDLFAIQMVADDDSNPTTLSLIDQLKMEPAKKQHKVMNYKNIIVRLPPEKIAEVAAQPDVVSIHPYFEPKLLDERQDMIVAGQLGLNGRPTGPGYVNFLAGKGIFEQDFVLSGLVIDITDSGVDNGTRNPNHFGLKRLQGTNLVSRVRYNRLFGTPAATNSTLAGCDGHGTLNAHIMVGNVPQLPIFDAFPFADDAGFHYGIGVCPFARVGSSVIFDPDRFTFPSFDDIQARAYDDGARVSGNSWGASTAGAYTIDSQQYDRLVRDAQGNSSILPTTGNQEMVIVFAAGNSGPASQTVGSPGTAKNVITVGAGENVQLFGAPDRSGINDFGANDANDMIFFSSRGPCEDGRKKPDIAAPGTHVSGGVAQSASPATNGTHLDCFNGSGVSGGPNPPGVTTNLYFPGGQEFYTASSGTSHACPAVAGGAALVIQNFYNTGVPSPSAALVKGYLMNSARYMTGSDANDDLWSTSQGMGEMNLDNAFNGLPRIIHDQVPAEVLTSSGQLRTITGQIADSTQPLRITLAWTDAPGATFGNAYNNDLDLVVTLNGQVYKGNVFNGPTSVTGRFADHKNNVESIFLPAGLSGTFVVQVVAANINSDAINLEAQNPRPEQDFALVAQNAVEIPTPVVVVESTPVINEVGGTINSSADPNETVTINIGLKNIGTQATSSLVATLIASNGVTNPSGPQNYGVLSPGGTNKSAPFTFTVNAACGSNITAVLKLNDGAVDLGIITFNVTVGQTFTNGFSVGTGSFISIQDLAPAIPYPSTLSVSNVARPIEKITVTLTNLTHTFLSDVDIMLVSPSGVAVELMSSIGFGVSVTNITISFDDDAVDRIPGGGPITSGSYLPSGSSSVTNFPIPAPRPPYATRLSGLKGTSANGDWSLYVVDSVGGDFGSIGGGWGLSFTNSTTVCNQQSADLAVTQTASSDRVVTGDFLTYSIVVTNRGPNIAPNSMLVETLANNVTITKIAASQGGYSVSNNIVTFNLGTIAIGTVVTAAITVTPTYSHTIQAGATVSSSSVDPNPANNTSTVTTLYGKIYSNPTFITVRDNTSASPYPSTIAVSGLTGYVNRVTVTLTNINHTFPRDMDIILVGPRGQKTYLMSDLGPGTTVTNLTFTFDDTAAFGLNQSLNPPGTYKPSNFDTDTDQFLGPAPAGPYSTNLAVFNGTDPNGTWSLYVMDDSRGNVGSIDNGWTLTFSVGNNFTNDLSVGMVDSPNPVPRGGTLTYTVGVTNNGPSGATGVILTNFLPASVTLKSVSVSQGISTVAGNSVICFFGNLAKNASATLTMVTTPTVIGQITNVASAAADDLDPNLANNTATRVTTVSVPEGSTTSVTPIIIPTSGPASLYPSVIHVSGLTGIVGKVTVTLNRLTHSFPQDLDVLLVGPNNVKTILMSHVGGSGSISDVTLAFDDAGAVLNQGQISSGTYKPTALQTVADLPSPAPAGPYPTNLFAFQGINPNGDWSLYVNDTSPPDGGSLNGWSFSIVFEPTLSLTRSGNNLLIAWPTNSVGFNLEGSSNLTSRVWFPIPTAPVTIGNQFIVTESLSNGLRFYRLKQ